MIKRFYEGKTILLTGTTGFLAKVILEKFLRTIPGIKRIYILIRPKAGKSPVERFQSDILDTKLFDKLKEMIPNWETFVHNMVTPIEGDLVILPIIIGKKRPRNKTGSSENYARRN